MLEWYKYILLSETTQCKSDLHGLLLCSSVYQMSQWSDLEGAEWVGVGTYSTCTVAVGAELLAAGASKWLLYYYHYHTTTTLLIHHLLTQCTSTWQGGLVSSNSSHLFGTWVKPTRGSQRPKLSHDLVGSINPHNTNLALLNMRISTGTSHTSPSCVTHIMRMSSTPRQVVS